MQGQQQALHAGTRGAKRLRRVGAVSSLLGIAPLVALGAPEQAAAEKIVVKNSRTKGPGSFNRAVGIANRDPGKDKILFASRVSGAIDTRGAKFRAPVALKGRRSVKLRGRGRNPKLQFSSNPGRWDEKPSAIRKLRLDDIGVYGAYTDLKISDTTIRGDGRSKADGFGAYYSDSTLRRSTISGWDIGVRASRSSVSVADSVIKRNEVGTHSAYQTIELKRSTISGNNDVGVRSSYYGFSVVSNSTVSGNRGFGLYGDMRIENSTVTGNAGLMNSYYYDSEVRNSVLTGNGRNGPDCISTGVLESGGGNVFSANSDCSRFAGERDRVVEGSGLKPLRNNGGPTSTHALRKGSPATGFAVPQHSPKRDQRGVKRGRDPDSGSFERR